MLQVWGYEMLCVSVGLVGYMFVGLLLIGVEVDGVLYNAECCLFGIIF